jgi:hypothetical protein
MSVSKYDRRVRNRDERSLPVTPRHDDNGAQNKRAKAPNRGTTERLFR